MESDLAPTLSNDYTSTNPVIPTQASQTAEPTSANSTIYINASQQDASNPPSTSPTRRGRPLNIQEKRRLVDIATQFGDDWSNGTPCREFWARVAHEFSISIGRAYSAQSCQRNVQHFIDQRKAQLRSEETGET